MTLTIFPLVIAFFGALVAPPILLTGMVSISNRDVKNHQFRMLSGYGALAISLCFLWVYALNTEQLYSGQWIEAFRLLAWLQIGIGFSSLVLASMTLWAVYEHAWELHRRTGMFAYLGGTVTSAATVLMLIMILIG